MTTAEYIAPRARRSGAGAPRTNSELDIRERLAWKLATEAKYSEVVHVAAAALTGALTWSAAPHFRVAGWVTAIVLTAALRFALRRLAARRPNRLAALTSTRVGTVAVSLAWGVGLLVVGRTLPVEPLALIIVMIAGIISGATVTLLADLPSFVILLAGLILPLAVAMEINPHMHFALFAWLGMLLTYGVGMLFFYRRSHAGLIDRIRTSMDLELATADAHEARDAERNLSRIIEATPDHVGIAGADGRMRYLNRAGREMVGIGANEDISKHTVMDMTPPRLHKWVMTTLKQEADREGSWTGESVLQHRDGSELPVSLVALVHKNNDGEVDSVSTIARDMSQEAAARAALQSARDAAQQATAAKSAFLANTSHEIRTPLNGILGMVELLLDTDLSPSQRRSVEVIASSGETLLHTINDLLDFSKIEAGQLDVEVTPFDLHQLLNSTVRLFAPRANTKGLELVCDIQRGVRQHVRGDPHRIRQVLNNLLSNAIKFTSSGEVVLYARSDRDAKVPSICFGVRDTGIGIRADQLQRVFEAFRQADVSTTRQYGGTGLGLSIARRLVEIMGGSLDVESEPGRGSDFHFTLTLPRAEESSAELRPQGSMNGVRVLVVDDHPTNRRVLGDMLRWAGADVQDAASASDALERLHGAAARGASYRLVVSDVQMPTRDGFGLAEDIRAHPALRDTQVMLLTSAGERGDAQRCRELGVRAYLQKPVSRVELIDAALATLGSSADTASRPLVTRGTIDETRKRLRILLAEDNPVNQEVAVAMLRKRGHDVQIAGNGREAVDAVRRGPRFDVVLMDLQMPELDGFAATREIRAIDGGDGGEPPIIALTANTTPGERDRCLAAGMNGYLAKPFKPHELFAVVEGWAPRDPMREAPTSTPVDLERFREMLSAAGIPETAARMIDVFLVDTPPRVMEMADAAQRGDLKSVQAIAHRLKSAAASICAVGLSDLLRRSESAAVADDVVEALALVRATEREYERVVEYLKATAAA